MGTRLLHLAGVPLTPTKIGIVIDLNHLRQLMREFAIEQEPDADRRVGLEWTLEIFLQWLRNKQREEKSNAQTT